MRFVCHSQLEQLANRSSDAVGLLGGGDLCGISTASAGQVYREPNCLRSTGAPCEDVHLVGVPCVRDTDRNPVEHAWLVLGILLLVLDLWFPLSWCRLFVFLLLCRVSVVLHHLWAGHHDDLSQWDHCVRVVQSLILIRVHLVRVALLAHGVPRSY